MKLKPMEKLTCHCGQTCFMHGTYGQPCWGELNVTEINDGIYIHFCQGHEGNLPDESGGYKPTKNENQTWE